MRNNGSYNFGASRRKRSKKKEPTELMKKSRKELKKTREFYRVSVGNICTNDNRQGGDNVSKRENRHVRVVPQANKCNGMESLPQNIEKSMTSSSRIVPKNTKMSRPSSFKPNKGVFSSGRTTNSSSSPNIGLVPLGRNNESVKLRPSLLMNGFSWMSKDDSNSMFNISKEPQPSSIFCNSRIAAQIVNNEAQEEETPTTIEALNPRLKLKSKQGTKANMRIYPDSLLSKNLSSRQMVEISSNKERHANSMDEHIRIHSRKPNNSLSGDGGIDDDKLNSKRMEPLSQEKTETHEDDDSEVEIHRPKKKRRRKLILTHYEDDDDGDQNLACAEIGTAGLTTQMDVVKDDSIKVNTFPSKSLKLQQYGSLPIDEPVWSGIIKISSNKNVSLAAHLSTKCCEKVWNLAGSLQQEITVRKLSRMEAWPKSFEAPGPTDNNIALYFLPREMRQDADLDQLVKEVVENDMVLQAVIGEAEMLIFPSLLLPEQHQTFQGKPYLWAVFKRRKNMVATAEAQQHGKGRRSAHDEIGEQQASHCSVDKESHMVTGLNTDLGLEAPKEVEKQSMEQEQNPSLASAKTPSPATVDPTINATTSANHGQTHSGLAVPTGAWFGFVVHGNPRIDQLIQELQREGALMVAMRGEMIGSGLGQATSTGREENEVPPSSTGRAAMV